MFAFFAEARYLPCPECGASLIGEEPGRHTCDPERRIEFQMFRLRGELGAFDQEVADYLDSPQGRFETWYAEHRRAA
jgi:hypothetical protein